MDTFRRFFCIVLFCVFSQVMCGHGSAQTSIRLNVYESRMEVSIEVTMPDLMKMAGGGITSEIESAPEEMRKFALEYQGEVQKHFKLVDDANQVLIPVTAWAQLPDFESAAIQNLGLDQQRLEVVLSYLFDSPPKSIAVVFDLGKDHHGSPVYADCVLRQNDEMTMLPEKVGPGFPMQFEFVWDEPVRPIHSLSDLSQASIGWRNRPVVSYLRADAGHVIWTVMGPLSAWGESAVDLSRLPSHLLAESLAEYFVLSSDGSALELLRSKAMCFPLNTLDYRMGREVHGGAPDTTLVRLDLYYDTTAATGWLEAACLHFPERSPRILLTHL